MNIDEYTKWINDDRAKREKEIVAKVNDLINFTHTIAIRISQSLDMDADVEKEYISKINCTAWPLVSGWENIKIPKLPCEFTLALLNDGRIVKLRREVYGLNDGPYSYVCDKVFDEEKVISSRYFYVEYGMNFCVLYQNIIKLAEKFNVPEDEINDWKLRYHSTMDLVDEFVSEF